MNDMLLFLGDAWLYVPIGTALGFMMCPTLRLAGIDFRPWLDGHVDAVIEAEDNSWIGRVRRTVHWLAGAACVTLVLAGVMLWFPADDCVFAPLRRDVSQFGWHCLAWWWHGAVLVGIGLGFVAAQILCDVIWRVTLHLARPRLPAPPVQLDEPPQGAAQPAERSPHRRRLIVCCDGTWNWPDKKGRETNVIRLVRAIEPCDGTVSQIVYYHPGVGTGNILDRLVGGGAGLGLSNAVKAAYGFLADNYRREDEIHVFGFSRGAYTARSVAGFVANVGILQKVEMEHFTDVWDAYTNRAKYRDPDSYQDQLDALAPARHRPNEVDIECIGVWDSVGALGVPGTRVCASIYEFHDLQLGPRVRFAFQALALDERRGNFQPAIWSRHGNPSVTQTLEQVWFPGVHSNIGGGYLEHGLSDAALLWMVSRIVNNKLLAINPDCLSHALDSTETERYARGLLQNSRTWFWKLLACPVCRPVCCTDPSERVHESALVRAQDAMARGGKYQSGRMRDWLHALPESRIARRCDTERIDPSPAAQTTRTGFVQRRPTLCGWVAAKLAGLA